jgi:predicted dinucleotide-binding enzyme
MIVLAALGRAIETVIELAGPANFAGKIVIDATNPIADEPPVHGVLKYTTGPNESLGERIQARIPKAQVVKAFNSVGNPLMVNPQFAQGAPTMFICGDSEQAKSQVATIVTNSGNPTIAGASFLRERSSPCACCGAFRDFWGTIGSMRSKCSTG